MNILKQKDNYIIVEACRLGLCEVYSKNYNQSVG